MTHLLNRHLRVGVWVGGAVFLGPGLAPPRVVADEPPGFTRSWQRNEEESDDPQEKLQAAMEAMRQGGGGFPPGGMGSRPGGGGFGGPGGGPPGGPGEPGRPPGMPGGFGGPAGMTEHMETKLEENEFHVIPSGEGRVQIFYLDGEKHVRETPQGMKMETRATRKGDGIVVEQKTEQGAKFTTTYELAPDGSRMVVTTRFEGKRMKDPVIIRTVYDSVEDEPVS